MLDQAVEVIRKRVDYFGVGEPVISPVGNDRILVQIPGLDTAKIQEARGTTFTRGELEFRLVSRTTANACERLMRARKSSRPSIGSRSTSCA